MDERSSLIHSYKIPINMFVIQVPQSHETLPNKQTRPPRNPSIAESLLTAAAIHLTNIVQTYKMMINTRKKYIAKRTTCDRKDL